MDSQLIEVKKRKLEETDTITFITEDEKKLKVDFEIIKVSQTISNMYEDTPLTSGIDTVPFPFPFKTLEKIIEWCKFRNENPINDCTSEYPGHNNNNSALSVQEKLGKKKENGWFYFLLPEWEKKFFNLETKEGVESTFDIILASNFLHIEELTQVSCSAIASLIRGRTLEDVKRRLYLPMDLDFTEEQKKRVKKENPWLYDDAEKN